MFPENYFVDNFLDVEEYQKYEDLLNSVLDFNTPESLPKHFWELLIFDKNLKDVRNFNLVHTYANKFKNIKDDEGLFDPIFDQIKNKFKIIVKDKLRILLVAQPSVDENVSRVWDGFHTDLESPEYDIMDDTDGGTDLQNLFTITSKKNRFSIFPGNLRHRTLYSTKNQFRYIYLFNYTGYNYE
jgi:hypothetical protein